MNRRGLTLLELLLSLALLSSVTLASVGWTTTSVDASREIDARARWETAARATLEIIAQDLAAGDRSRRRIDGERNPTWITSEGSSLAVVVRAAPFSEDVLAIYTLNQGASQLSRSQPSQSRTSENDRLLLGDVAAFEAHLTPASLESDMPAHLDSRIESHAGWTVSRVFWIRDRRQP